MRIFKKNSVVVAVLYVTPPASQKRGGVSVGMFGDGGQWLRFNDVLVDEFNMTNQTLEAECFGGTYKPKPSESQVTYMYITCSLTPLKL